MWHKMLSVCLFCSATFFSLCLQGKAQFHSRQAKTRVVRTKYGSVQGFVSRVGRDAEQQRHVEIFLGLPYASPPTGNYRFSPTRPPTHWSNVRMATSHGPVCPQVIPSTSNTTEALKNMSLSRLKYLRSVRRKLDGQSEDCLHLNIYIPIQEGISNEDLEERYPVMVYIHGEDYSWGSGNLYDGSVLASYGNVIVITFNYRLGVLGFLNTNVNPERNPNMANYGIMDQIAVLKWIQENIQHFGGDAHSVTLFGSQTGASFIQLLMQSPVVVPGLFHRVIMMSGSALSNWAIVGDPVHYAVKLASSLNCSIPRNMMSDHKEIIKCLRAKSFRDLTAFDFGTPSFLTSMGPSRDGIIIQTDFSLNDLTSYSASSGKEKRSSSKSVQYEVIIGLNEDETANHFSEIQLKQGMSPDDRDKFIRTLIRNNYEFHLNEIFATVQNEYSYNMMSEEQEFNPYLNQWQASRALTDKLYLAPILETANWCAESRFKTFFYIFGFSEKNFIKQEKMNRQIRSQRGSLLPLLFGIPFAPELNKQEQWATLGRLSGRAASVSQTIITMWTNFAKTGDPKRPNSVESVFKRRTGPKQPVVNKNNNLIWERFDSTKQAYLHIDSSLGMKHHYRLHSMSIWLNLIPKLHQAGSNNIFPQHNTLFGHDDPSLFTGVVRPSSFSHGYQVNRKYFDTTSPSPPATTCLPVNSFGQIISSSSESQDSPNALVRWEKASEHAYKQAMYLTIGLGTLLLAVNVWFLLCLFFCRSKISCCAPNGLSGEENGGGIGCKEYSCDTDLVGLGNESVQSFRELQQHGKRQISRQDSLSKGRGESMRLLQPAHLLVEESRSSSSGSSSGACSHRHSQQNRRSSSLEGSVILSNDEGVDYSLHHPGSQWKADKEYDQHLAAKDFRRNDPKRNSQTLPLQGKGMASHGNKDQREIFITTTLGKKIAHTRRSNCRLNEISASIASSDRGYDVTSPNGSSSTASSQGVAIILPPPKEMLTSSLKKYPSASTSNENAMGRQQYKNSSPCPPLSNTGAMSPKKLSTFSSPNNAVTTTSNSSKSTELTLKASSPSAPIVSFGGETILH